jgi:hypothetical protein
MQFGSAGSTTHLTCVLLNAAIGVQITHVAEIGGWNKPKKGSDGS